jgi:hypothetical protein
VSQFKSDWENILDNMDPNVDIGDEALKNILYDQMKQPKAFDSEVKHYLRTPADRTYRFLIGAIDRYLDIDKMERNRKAQLQGQERERDQKQALGAVAPASDSRSGGGYPAGTPPAPATRSPPPCIGFQTGECQKGKNCTYAQVKVSESELQELKDRRNSYFQTLNAKGKGKGKSKGKGTRGTSLPPSATSSQQWNTPGICRDWSNTGKCDQRDSCPYSHPQKRSAQKQDSTAVPAAESSLTLPQATVAVGEPFTSVMVGDTLRAAKSSENAEGDGILVPAVGDTLQAQRQSKTVTWDKVQTYQFPYPG